MAVISLIIPVYNTEESKLGRCFDSIYGQICKDFEVLVIDDGSDDWCAEYLSICQKSYGFSLIRQSNSGVSAARNYGLALSGGEYVMFVDSDDSLEEGCLSRIASLISKSDADVILGGIKIIEENGNIKKCAISNEKNITYSGSEIQKLQKYMLAIQCENNSEELSGLRCSGPWAKAIKRKVARNVEFDSKLPVYEDLFYNLSVLDNSQTVVVDTDIWYNYFIYNDSAMHKFRINGIQEQKNVMENLIIFKHSHDKSFGAAIALKTIECLRRMFAGTIFFTKKHPIRKIHTVREVLRDDMVCELLNDLNERLYRSTTWKEKVFRFSLKKKYAFIVSMYYIFIRY